jgi:hypothetical protein
MPEPLFEFTAIDSYPVPASEEGAIVITIDPTTGTMIVAVPDEDPVNYPLVDEEDEPLPRAIFIDTEPTPNQLQVGTVTYAREGLDVQCFPLNEYDDISFIVTTTGGHLGILDIRDIARQLPVHTYYFDMMPIVLSTAGNFLVVKTLYYEDTDPYGPWHDIS